MGSVWVARHLSLGIDVALKFVSAELAAREDIRGRFEREAKGAAKIQSPHVVKMIDHGVDEDDRLFIAMELLDGEDLATRLERQSRLSLGDAAFLLRDAAKGLSKAHAAGIVHRDVKPDNLFLCRDDDGFVVKVLDFGVARELGPSHEAAFRTGTGALVGTPAYMSPEQALGGRTIDHRSDLFSLAVVAYRALTGRVPFSRDGLGETIMAIASDTAPPPSTVRPDVGPALDAWFVRALAKAPAARFDSARELADAVAEACRTDGYAGSLPELRIPSAEVSGPARVVSHADAVTVASEPGLVTAPPSVAATLVQVQSAETLAGASSHRRSRSAGRLAPWLVAGAAVSVAGVVLVLRGSAPAAPAVTVSAAPTPSVAESPSARAVEARSAPIVEPPPAAATASASASAPSPVAPPRKAPAAKPGAPGPTPTPPAKPDWGI